LLLLAIPIGQLSSGWELPDRMFFGVTIRIPGHAGAISNIQEILAKNSSSDKDDAESRRDTEQV
jgi:hypothetical protein